MSEAIGKAAGEIWAYLEKNGPATVNKLGTDTEINKNDIQRAIGWLAREDKIVIDQKGRVETIGLK
jgi:hypothetical protein